MRDQSVEAIAPSLLPELPAVKASVVARLAAAQLPGWATPVGISTLALLVVQSIDHRLMPDSIPLTVLATGSLLVLFIALYIAIACGDHRLAPARRRLVTLCLLIGLAINTAVRVVLIIPHLAEHDRYRIDAGAATDCATQQFMHGHDPYTNVHMLTCLNSHGLAFNQTTPMRAGAFWSLATYPSGSVAGKDLGSRAFANLMWNRYWKDLSLEKRNSAYVSPEFETRFNYPGGAILIGVVAWAFGVRDLVGLFLAAVLISSYLIYRHADPRIRLATALLLLGDAPLLLDSAVGATDVLYAMILVLYWQVRERPMASGLLLGLAAATRQQAWFFLPFLLYLGWRGGGWRDLRLRGLPALLAFIACNAPFILMGPGDWLAGVIGPVRDPLFAEGVGLIALPIAVLKQNLGSPLLYAALEVAGMVLVFRLFMRRCLASPGLAMLLPLVPLVLAWRSLHTYFLILPLLATAVLAGVDEEAWTARRWAWHRQESSVAVPELVPAAREAGG